MRKIKVFEKPDNISYETIRDVFQQVHKANFDAGIIMGVSNFPPDAQKRQVGKQ